MNDKYPWFQSDPKIDERFTQFYMQINGFDLFKIAESKQVMCSLYRNENIRNYEYKS